MNEYLSPCIMSPDTYSFKSYDEPYLIVRWIGPEDQLVFWGLNTLGEAVDRLGKVWWKVHHFYSVYERTDKPGVYRKV